MHTKAGLGGRFGKSFVVFPSLEESFGAVRYHGTKDPNINLR
jgi:hypothetical protein